MPDDCCNVVIKTTLKQNKRFQFQVACSNSNFLGYKVSKTKGYKNFF